MPWFVIARTNRSVAGPVGTVSYQFSQPVGELGFGIGSIDSDEQVVITAHYADGSSGPITNSVSYTTAPLAPSSWPTQPTVYYASAGSSTSNGTFTGNGSVYVAIPASTPVTSIDISYSLTSSTTGGIGLTPPRFLQCNPVPAAVPTVNHAGLLALLAALMLLPWWLRRR